MRRLLGGVLLMVGFLAGSGVALAQKSLPNPLVQPPKRSAPAGAPDGAPQEGAAPQGQAPAASNEGGKQADSAMSEILGRVSGLYVSAIIGDMAVLRSSVGGGGAAAGAGSGQAAGGAAGSAGGSAASAGGGGARSMVYFVRDAEPFHIFDRHRLLPRIQDTTVVLYLIPDDPKDAGRRPQLVFRSTLDSVGTAQPYVPGKMESPGGGDGYQSLIGTGGGGGSGAKAAGGAGGGK